MALVTAPDLKTARKLAQSVLKARLAACVNIIPRIESHYWWKGKLEAGNEVLLILKTTVRCLNRLEAMVIKEHPYETPEFIAFSISAGNQRYLDWLDRSVSRKA